MSLQYSVTVRNAQLDALETAVGVSAILKIYDLTASAPANCAAAITGTVLATMTLPSDWMAAASAGSKAMLGTWQDASADNAGVADFFRLFANDGTTCHAQGTVTLTAGGGDMTLDNTNITAGQSVTVTSFTVSAGNA
jgi:hypothetical protein